MKKQLLFWLMLPLMAFTSFEWITVSLDQRASIDFPTKPTQQEMSGNPTWLADLNNDARCMAMMVDFKNFGMDSAQLAAELAAPKFYADFKGGVLGQLPGSTLISETTGSVQGYKTAEYVIDMGKKDTSSLNIMYNKNIFVGSMMYTLNFFEKTGKPQEQARNQFFNSFKIK